MIRSVSSVGLLLAAFLAGPARAEAPRPVNTWVAVIAIRDYDDAKIPRLDAAHEDARGFREALTDRAGIDETHVLELTDDRGDDGRAPKLLNLTRRLAEFLKKAAPEDSVVVFFSGHGALVRGRICLVPKDAHPEKLGTLLDAGQLGELLDRCRARTKLLVLDCGHTDPTGAPLTIPGSKPVVPDPREARGGARSSFAVLSGGPGESSGRPPAGGGRSPFAERLCLGLEGAADSDGDGRISTSEILSFTRRRRAADPDRAERDAPSGDLLTLKPEEVETVTTRLAEQLHREIRDRGLKTVRVAREFRISEAGPAHRPTLARCTLPVDAAEDLRNKLSRLASSSGEYTVVVGDRLLPRVGGEDGNEDEAEIYGELILPAEALASEAGSIALVCEVDTAKAGRLASLAGQIHLRPSLFPQLGVTLSPDPPDGVAQPPNELVQVINMANRSNALLAPPGDQQPLFRVEVYSSLLTDRLTTGASRAEWKLKPILTTGQQDVLRTLKADSRSAVIGVRKGEILRFRLINDSDRAVGVVLMVDGLNTSGRVAQSQEKADVWIVPAKSSADVTGWGRRRAATPVVAGQMGDWDFDAFVVEEAPEGLDAERSAADKLGMISATFYAEQPPGARGGLRIGQGLRETRPLQYVSWRGKGEILASYPIGYVAADDQGVPR